MLQYLITILRMNMPKSEKGQDLAEYGLLVAFIAIIAAAGVTLFGGEVLTFFNELADNVLR
jgi:Flp pilus assembly pilin Flp